MKTHLFKFNAMINPSTAKSTTRGKRKKNLSVTEDISKPSRRQIRYSTPSITEAPVSRLKRFNFENKKSDEQTPDFSYIIKSNLK